MNKSASIIALHGFFGSPRDFTCLKLCGLKAPYIFNSTISSLPSWASRFNNHVPPNSILLGYSMGARLALHCLLDDEKRYQAAIILAAHPGLASEKERLSRYHKDCQWAQQIESLPWSQLMQQWDKQPILKGSWGPERCEQDFARKSLSLAMKRFSLGTQKDLTADINELTLPILWLYPAAEAHNLSKIKLKNSRSRAIAMQGGHRFIFTHRAQVYAHIRSFLYEMRVAGS